MDCKEFFNRYTEYRDGLMSPEDVARAEVHLSGCPSCQRYRRVVDRGVRELRTVSSATAGEDFQHRLQHRIYHLKDGETLAGGDTRSSAASAVTAVGIAILLTAAAWSPVLRQAGNSVTLPALVVNPPAGAGLAGGLQLPTSAFFREGEPWRSRPAPRWSPPPTLWTGSASSGTSARLGASSMAAWASASSNRGGGSLGSSGVSLSSPTSRPVFFNAASVSLGLGPGRVVGLDLD